MTQLKTLSYASGRPEIVEGNEMSLPIYIIFSQAIYWLVVFALDEVVNVYAKVGIAMVISLLVVLILAKLENEGLL